MIRQVAILRTLTSTAGSMSLPRLPREGRNVREMRDKSALRRTVFAVSRDEFERLIAGAREKKPEDVARLWHLLGNGEHLRPATALHDWFEFRNTPQEIESLIPDVPNPILLGTSYLEKIFANPGKGTNDIRMQLKKLCSTGFIQGTGPKGGHPRSPHNWADIEFVRGMAYSLVKQIRRARRYSRKGSILSVASLRLRSIAWELTMRPWPAWSKTSALSTRPSKIISWRTSWPPKRSEPPICVYSVVREESPQRQAA